jgi:hypothetical protein
MVMHPNKTRDHRAPMQVGRRRAVWDPDGAGVADCRNATVLDDHCLIVFTRVAGAVDDSNMRQRDNGRHRPNEFTGVSTAGRYKRRRQQETESSHLNQLFLWGGLRSAGSNMIAA